MLIYETEGFIEVEAKDIISLSRSVATVCFGDSGQAGFNVHAVLCEFKDSEHQRCSVAFHSKVLKRALVFSVKNPENITSMQNGEDILAELGFSLEKVNLQLSPAMLEVVLKDVPGITTPPVARKVRREKELLLSELQKDVGNDPESATGKRSALKLNSEKRLDERSLELQKILTDLLSPQEIGDGYSAAMEQVKDITERLEKAELLLEEERKQREFSETITEAAEKRIQELEEILVDVETKSAGEIKEKQKAAKLRTRIKELEEQLQGAVQGLAAEKDNQASFIADVKSANNQIASLEEQLKKSEKDLSGSLDRLAEVESRNDQLNSHMQKLEAELEEASATASQLAETVNASEDLQRVLAAANSNLETAQSQNEVLTEQLSAADERIQQLKGEVENAEGRPAEPINDAELMSLREELQKERSVRNRLERGAAEDENRIRELEESIEQLQQKSKEETKDNSSELLESLKAEMHEQKRKVIEVQAAREDLEAELEQGHKMIDSLEKMVRETSKMQGQDSSAVAEKEKEIVKLEAKIELLNEQLEHERSRQGQLVQVAAATVSDDEAIPKRRPLKKTVSMSIDPNLETHQTKKAPVAAKPLPHDLRPEPRKGDFFIPDWDLQGLPCETSSQVVRAWETVFNVQIALDGYPTQFCMAFLVVLKVGNAKKLYQMFRLKQSKYTLVKAPAKTPKNEGDLQKAINEGLKFLKSCGFEMEEMPKEYVDNTLGTYFLGK